MKSMISVLAWTGLALVVFATVDGFERKLGDSLTPELLAAVRGAGLGQNATTTFGACEATNKTGAQITALECEADPANFGKKCIRCFLDSYKDVVWNTSGKFFEVQNQFRNCNGNKHQGDCVRRNNDPNDTFCTGYVQVLDPEGNNVGCTGAHIPVLIEQVSDPDPGEGTGG